MRNLSRNLLFAAVMGGIVAAPTAAFAMHRYSDVPDDSIYAGAIERLSDAGVIEGCTTTAYCPGDSLTRGQMALLLDRQSGNGDVAPSVDAATLMGMTPAQLRGVTGDTGPAGPKGDTGGPGAKGDTGATGATGAAGDAGTPGANGDTGPVGPAGAAGPAGAKGDTGAAGPAGAKGDAGAPGETGPIGPQGSKGDIGPAGPSGINEATQFYALMPPDNADTVPPGGDVDFPQNGPSTSDSISRTAPDAFALADIGVYRISYQVPVSEQGQLVLTLNGAELAYTVAGRGTGTSQMTATVLVQTTAINSVLTLRNPVGNPSALTITPLAGGLEPVSALLLIEQLA